MFFYSQGIEDCHFDLLHQPLNLWEHIGQKKESVYNFDCHVHLLSTSLWAS
jgi:hypothetical protein